MPLFGILNANSVYEIGTCKLAFKRQNLGFRPWRKLTPGPGLFIFRKIVEQDEEEEISSSSSFEDLASEIVKED